jgi:hypothetical protein
LLKKKFFFQLGSQPDGKLDHQQNLLQHGKRSFFTPGALGSAAAYLDIFLTKSGSDFLNLQLTDLDTFTVICTDVLH